MDGELKKRTQTTGEELANTISHGVGALLAAVGAAPLIVRGMMGGSPWACWPASPWGPCWP